MRSQRLNRISKTVLSGLVLIALLAFSSSSVFASTAANTQITNIVTVSYSNTAGVSQSDVLGSVTVEVNLRAAAPTLTIPANETTSEATALSTNAQELSYTITSNANGPDDYDLTQAIVESNSNLSNVTGTPSFLPDPVSLGATTIAVPPSSGDFSITVPYDGNYDTDPTSVNGITDDDILVINGNEYVVATAGVSETAANNQATITFTTALSAADATWAALGTPIGERQTFTLDFTTGSLTDPTLPISSHNVTVTATAENGSGPAISSGITYVFVTRGNLVVTKEVSTDGGTNWLTTGATAAPGATLIYRVTILNNGHSNATLATATDPVPQFTTYVADSSLLNGITVDGDGSSSPLVGGLIVDDDGSRAAGAIATGIIQSGHSAVVIYQVTIDN